jgi:predicted alpha/beta hydrolase
VAASRATEPGASLRSLAAALDARAEAERQAIRTNTALSSALVFLTMAAGYAAPSASRYVFFAVLPLALQQLFASRHHARRIALESAARAARAGLPGPRLPCAWLDGAALAIRDSYLLLFAGFDAAWLAHAYLLPSPAASWQVYLQRLSIGPLPGSALVWFTVAFWFVYPVLFLYGRFLDASGKAGELSAVPAPVLGNAARSVERTAFSLRVHTRDGTAIHLNGYRLPRPGGRALILWPGFFQSAVVYDLPAEPLTLAEHLHQRGFDLWLVHPRGTGGSGGARLRSSLDDYAASDLPAIIAFVADKVAQPPLLVGHSQGGITAILSLMGATFRHDGTIALSDGEARQRQSLLAGLVTLGAFPSFVSSQPSALHRFVRDGFSLRIFGSTLHIPLAPLLRIVRLVPFLPVPPGVRWRQALLASPALRCLLYPLYALLRLASLLPAWEFLYHIPNVSLRARERLFLLSIEGTFGDILEQFYQAVLHSRLCSLDGRVDYSAEYARIVLPVSFITMELDGFVDQPSLVRYLYEVVSSSLKQRLHIPGIGHEDFFMNAAHYSQLSAGIEQLRDALPLAAGNGAGHVATH